MMGEAAERLAPPPGVPRVSPQAVGTQKHGQQERLQEAAGAMR
jgi:hypothetical protein